MAVYVGTEFDLAQFGANKIKRTTLGIDEFSIENITYLLSRYERKNIINICNEKLTGVVTVELERYGIILPERSSEPVNMENVTHFYLAVYTGPEIEPGSIYLPRKGRLNWLEITKYVVGTRSS
jgi:hypothetical protein